MVSLLTALLKSRRRDNSEISEKNNIEKALVFVRNKRTYRAHYPFNAPFAKPHIYAKDRGSENIKLAEKFPNYRYFIAAEENTVEEFTMNELNKAER